MSPNASASTSSGSPPKSAQSAQSVTATTNGHLPHLAIVDRLVELPLVNSAWDYANARYAALKSSSPLVTSTLDRAEGALQLVVTTVTPVLSKIEQPIHYADNLAVQGLDLIESKVGSLQKSSTELKTSTLSLVDQTKTRFESVKSQTYAKVQSVLNLPTTTNVLPLVDQILGASESVLDYLLPESKSETTQQNGSPKKIADQSSAVPESSDLKTLFQLVFVRVRNFSDKIRVRLVDYGRDRWIPSLFGSLIALKEKLLGTTSGLVSNVQQKLAAAANQSNGHSPSKAASANGSPKSSKSTSTSSATASNGDASPTNKSTETPSDGGHQS